MGGGGIEGELGGRGGKGARENGPDGDIRSSKENMVAHLDEISRETV